MHDLPARPDLGQLRHQARDLLRAARAGDPAAAGRIQAVSGRMTLAAAQLAVAREYGFASWPRLKAEVEARGTDLAQKVDAFLEASVRDWTGRAARMLAVTPEIAGHDFRTAVILGDAARVRETLRRDPGLATQTEPRRGWTPLHAVCGSRWHRLDPARGEGLLAVARLLLAAGADPSARTGAHNDGWSPLRCAVAGAANPAITSLLLEHGAVPDDHDLYLACFGGDDHESLRLLLSHAPNVAETTALAAPISTGDTEGVRLLLQAGADPNRLPPADLYGVGHADDPPWPAAYAAVRSRCPAELVELLLGHGADPDAAGPDGRSPYALATSQGRTDLTGLLRGYGARGDASDVDRFLSACLRTDHAEAKRQSAAHPGLPGQVARARPDAVVQAAEAGRTQAIRLLLDLGFDIEGRGDNGATALHAAAYSGSAGTVRFLLARGADIEARDTTWDSPPLGWAIIGSGERPGSNPSPDWITTVRTLIEAGASTQGITLSPDDPKPPSPDVAQLLRGYGIGAG
jgi:ankyrin repeat protein